MGDAKDEIPMEEVMKHTTSDSAWLSIHGKVRTRGRWSPIHAERGRARRVATTRLRRRRNTMHISASNSPSHSPSPRPTRRAVF